MTMFLSPLYRRLKRIPFVRKWARVYNGLDNAEHGWVTPMNQSYPFWQRRFTVARLYLAVYVTIFIAGSFALLEVTRSLVYHQPMSMPRLVSYGAIMAIDLLVYWLLKSRVGQRHPAWGFVGWSLSLQVIPQTILVMLQADTTWGTLTDVYGWVFAFFFQATMVPVCWPRHALVQAIAILHGWVLYGWLGESVRAVATQSRSGFVLDLFWICLICNVSVFLYERLQRTQFETQGTLAKTYRQLSQAESRYRSLVENALDGIFRSSPSGQYLSVNPAMARINGYDDPEALMNGIQDIATQVYADPQQRSRFLAAMADQDQVVGFESEVLRTDGSTVWVAENTRAVRDSRGKIIAFEGTMTNISPRKQAEAKTLRALETERELNHLKSQFLSTASHQFRTPLTTILASTEALAHYSDRWTPEKRERTFERIQKAVRNMTHLLDEVLTLEKTGASRMEPTLELIHLQHFCEDLVDEFRISLPAEQTLEFRCEALDFDVGHCVSLDVTLLRHILTNLLSNAIKYSPNQTPVIFEVFYDEQKAIFRVQDSGIGIPAADCDRLFESFHRASNVGSLPGTGLGLTIAQRSVALHRGTIELDSEVGVGTTFTVTLPTDLSVTPLIPPSCPLPEASPLSLKSHTQGETV